MKNVIVLALFLSTACTSVPRKVMGPDGSEYWKIECVELEDCYQQADRKCEKHRQTNMSSQTNTTLKQILIQCE